MAIQPIQRAQQAPPAQEAAACMPRFIQEAFESIKNFFSKIGVANLVGYSVIVLSAYLFGAMAGIVTAAIFGLYKIMECRTAVPGERVEVLPPGTIRSRFTQRNIADNDYNLDEFQQEFDEAVMPFREPIPRLHNQTCCGITAALINFFYTYGFRGMNPFRLDAMLARGIQVDAAVRERGHFGVRRIDIEEFFGNLNPDHLRHVGFDPGVLPIQRPNFAEMIQQLHAQRANGPIAGAMFCRNHFTGLYIARDPVGRIEQIYVSESRNRFQDGIRYDSGPNQGAMIVPIGNTIEEAAAHLTRLYGNAADVTLYPIFRPHD
ncbi:MAG: hypothetical protein K1X28_04195 [Parachlamydiales bacterium]|nr:hypothetical protein [Parachlamydiales bacterium]